MDSLKRCFAYVQLTIVCMLVIGEIIAFSVSQWMVSTFVNSVPRVVAMDSLIVLKAYVQLTIVYMCVIILIIAFAVVICKYIVDAI
jgi:hypothetical protein